ncbi:CBS domain containing protein (fragment) [Candidatus Sulfopaludibacter sp. SbA3]
MPAHPVFIGPQGLLGCVVAGVLAGALSALLTMAVYAAEDVFRLLPIHWMWWPAIGGLVIGIGGLVFPQALGVGYDTIGALLQGEVPRNLILGILLVKSVIWAVSLGSGTSGGVLAPLLMMGGALGGIEAMFLPHEGAGFWPLVSMGAILGGTMRSPFTGIIFALELTHDVNMLVPLLLAVTIAHGFTVLTLRRSILTEKVARRGFHLSREYAVDPLEILFVRDVMRDNIVALPADATAADLAGAVHTDHERKGQLLYPVVGEDRRLVGAITRNSLHHLLHNGQPPGTRLAEVADTNPVVAFADEPLRLVVNRMAETGYTRFPVVEREDSQTLVGMVGLHDLLQARTRSIQEERSRERVLRIRLPFRPSSAVTDKPPA